MKALSDVEKQDFRKYFVEKPVGFSAARNKAIVEKTIRETDQRMAQALKDKVKQYEERADATVSFLRAVDKGKIPNVEKYFGRKLLAKLRGDEIRTKLMEHVRGLNKFGQIVKPF